MVFDELKNDDFDKDQPGLILPVDDIVVGFAKQLSNGGSLAGDSRSSRFTRTSLQEMFGQRLGIETGAKHTAFSKSGQAAEVKQVTYLTQQTLPKTASEIKGIREPLPAGDKLTASPGKVLVAITVMFKLDATDADKKVAWAPVPCASSPSRATGGSTTTPLGTVQPVGNTWHAWVNRPDDYLFIEAASGDHGATSCSRSTRRSSSRRPTPSPSPATPGGKSGGVDAYTFEDGTFLEVKRLTKISLDGVRVTVGMPPTAPSTTRSASSA